MTLDSQKTALYWDIENRSGLEYTLENIADVLTAEGFVPKDAGKTKLRETPFIKDGVEIEYSPNGGSALILMNLYPCPDSGSDYGSKTVETMQPTFRAIQQLMKLSSIGFSLRYVDVRYQEGPRHTYPQEAVFPYR